MKRFSKIETLKKKFHRQWLLIRVGKADKASTTPLTGQLLSHSPHRDEVYKKLFSLPKKQNLLVEYSEDNLPKGYIAAFNVFK